MSGFISDNRFLNDSEMTVNAKYVYGYLTARGWTGQAVAGMLGNMETESTINPGIWQNLDAGNLSGGFGLVQWTPASKFINWCTTYGYDAGHMDTALNRIIYELENGLQWISTDDYPLSFAEFKISTLTPEYLAWAFLNNYERPAEPLQPARATQARKWYNLLTSGSDPDEPVDPDEPGEQWKPKPMSFLLRLLTTTRRL